MHLSVRKSRENYRQIHVYEKSKASLWRNLSTGTPQNFVFSEQPSTEIIQHYILIQTLSFLPRLPTHQDGIENGDKVY